MRLENIGFVVQHPYYRNYASKMNGEIFEIATGKLCEIVDIFGMKFIRLKLNHAEGQKCHTMPVGIFIWECWIDLLPNDKANAYKNDDNSDNRLDNLELADSVKYMYRNE